MRVSHHSAGESFLQRAESFLLQAEAENNLILGIAGSWRDYSSDLTDRPYLATVEREHAVVACALRTPPRNVMVTRAKDDALEALASDLRKVYGELPGVLAPNATAKTFSQIWARHVGAAVQPGVRQRIYQLDRVSPVNTCPGGFRPATQEDLDFAVKWAHAFTDETGAVMDERKAHQAIAAGSLFLWEDKEPVSMAMWQGQTPNGVRVSFVFTPMDRRNRGYASACVAALSQHLLDQGHQFCFLFTDLANPTSNHIYQRIGYHPVCDVSDYLFAA